MKKFTSCLTATACVVAMLAVTASAVPPTQTEKQMRTGAEIRMSRTTDVLQAGPLLDSTGFELSDGWEARDGVNNGFICGPENFAVCTNPVSGACPDPGGNCCIDDPNPDTGWYVSISSMHCNEPHIDTVNPATGTQHLRFLRAGSTAEGHWGVDPGCVGFAGECRVSAFSPLALGDGPLDVGITNTDVDIYSSATNNSSFIVFEVAEAAGTSIAGYTYFHYFGGVYAYEVGVAFHPAGSWTPGAYFHLNLNHDPCNNLLTYTTSDGGVNFSHPMTTMAPWVSRVILMTENKGEIWDIDNFAIVRDGPCPTTCGADGIEAGEDCDFGVGEDANCPGRCVAPGATGPDGEIECTCIVLGKDACEAVDLVNGASDHLTVGGWFSFVADTPAMAIDMCDTLGFDSAIDVWTSTDPGNEDCALIGDETTSILLRRNDDCNVDDPTYGPDSDALASCHPVGPPWQSCTCLPTTIGQTYWVAATRGPVIGATRSMNATKRLDCGAVWDAGACCDGVSGTCTDEVLPGDCAGDLDTFTLNKFCGDLTCDAVPGSCCDSAPGLGGPCSDGVLNADCQGTYQAWSGTVPCDGSCAEITGACCDPLNGFCSVTLQGDCTATHPGGPVWTVGATCGEVSCDPALGACCNTRFGTCTDDVILADCGGANLSWTKGDVCSATTCPDPFIPTVSQWGLVIMTLLLLIGAKVYFGRREALA